MRALTLEVSGRSHGERQITVVRRSGRLDRIVMARLLILANIARRDAVECHAGQRAGTLYKFRQGL